MLTTLSSLLNQNTGSVKMELKIHSSGQYELLVSPVATFADRSDELTILKAALSTPLRIIGAAEEIETALRDRINAAQPVRNQWTAAVDRAQQALDEQKAKTAAVSKGQPAASQHKTPIASGQREPAALELTNDEDFDL